MSKHLSSAALYNLPSGQRIHPCRLIHKDGTLMWKHALLYNNEAFIPETEAQEQHIIKTAQRLEELNSWVSQGLEPWECLQPVAWFYPLTDELQDGISVYFKHAVLETEPVLLALLEHIQEHEFLEVRCNHIFFKRC